MTTNALLNQFESEIIASSSIPYCQVQNPPNLSLAQIQDLNLPWGWFIPQEQAELAEFIPPSEIWTPTALSFGEDSGQPRTIAGFLTRKIKIVVLHTSNIEVQEKTAKGWKYSGLAYKSGNITPFGQLAKQDRERHRLRTRYLIFFLGDKQELLHPAPIKIGINAGVGAAFANELKAFRKEIEAIFFAQRGERQQQLSYRAHFLTIFEAEFGLHKNGDKSPFLYPFRRSTPNKSGKVVNYEREIKLQNKPLAQLIISKTSDTGQEILRAWEEYQDFSSKYQDELDKSDESENEEIVF